MKEQCPQWIPATILRRDCSLQMINDSSWGKGDEVRRMMLDDGVLNRSNLSPLLAFFCAERGKVVGFLYIF